MANVKEAQMAKDDLLDNIQKIVLCGRAMLDAIEDLTNLYCDSVAGGSEGASQFAESAKCKVESANEHADKAAAKPEPAKQADVKAEAPRTATLEEVRGLLAEKSRSGLRVEVKALLTAHGVEKLSEITDPAELGRLLREAEKIGVADGQ